MMIRYFSQILMFRYCVFFPSCVRVLNGEEGFKEAFKSEEEGSFLE